MRWIEIYLQPPLAGEEYFTGSMDDITRRIQGQMLEDTYHLLGDMALRGMGAQSMLELATMRLGEIFSCGVIAAQWVDDYCVKASSEEYLPTLGSHRSYLSLKDFSTPGSLRFSGDSLPPTLMELAQREYGIHSVLVAPFSIGRNALGRFIFMSRRKNAFGDYEGVAIRLAVERVRLLLQADHDQQWLHLIGSALETAANAVMITRADSVIMWANAALSALSGFTREEILGKTPRMFNSGEHPQVFWKHFWETISHGQSWRHEVINQHKDGTLYPIRQTVTPIQNARGEVTHFISVQEDIRQEKASEDKLRYSATHDLLTGLPNRMLMQEHLQHAINAAQRGSHVVGILFIDLDQFKIINDSLGHQVGDGLLRQVSARLAACIRVGDTLARLGGGTSSWSYCQASTRRWTPP
jgi:PAS domain S-box-containing protein